MLFSISMVPARIPLAGKLGEFTLFTQLAKRLIIVSTNINGFSLASHGGFAKHPRSAAGMIVLVHTVYKYINS